MLFEKVPLRQLASKGKEVLVSKQKGGLLPKFFGTGMKNKIPPLDEIGKEIDEIFQSLLSEELDGKGLYQFLMLKVKNLPSWTSERGNFLLLGGKNQVWLQILALGSGFRAP